MRRRIIGALGVLAIGAVYNSCGPPPIPLGGRITYAWGCRMEAPDHPMCSGGTIVYSGAPTLDNSLRLDCSVTNEMPGPTQVRFFIARGGTRFSDSVGISVCGQLSAPGAALTNGNVDINTGQPATGVLSMVMRAQLGSTCEVVITERTGSSFSGRIRCNDAHDDQVPYRNIYIRGNAMTEMAEFGDFHFDSCAVRASSACQ
jgi:hypothetical protein